MHHQEKVSVEGLQVMFMLPSLLGSSRSNTAQDLREADFLLNFPQDPKGDKGKFKLVESSNTTGIHRYLITTFARSYNSDMV